MQCSQTIKDLLVQRFLCPETDIKFSLKGKLSDEKTFFRFSNDILCYGRVCTDQNPPGLNGKLIDVSDEVGSENGIIYLPFDASEIVDNLRLERYTANSIDHQTTLGTIARQIYYLFRPAMPVAVRRHLQRAWLTFRPQGPFPRWPVDHTVDSLLKHLLLLRFEPKESTVSLSFGFGQKEPPVVP